MTSTCYFTILFLSANKAYLWSRMNANLFHFERLFYVVRCKLILKKGKRKVLKTRPLEYSKKRNALKAKSTSSIVLNSLALYICGNLIQFYDFWNNMVRSIHFYLNKSSSKSKIRCIVKVHNT